MQQSHLKQWGIAFVGMVVAVAVAYAFLDQPIAFYASAHFAKKPWFDALTQIPEYMGRVGMLVFVVSGIYGLIGRPLPQLLAVVLASSVSLVVASAIKETLKFAFGRTWPETWVQNNPSLVRDGVYGFNPFHGGQGYGSFPSGHTTAACAFVAVLWICCPRFRVLYAVVIAAVVIGLLGADYHFLSDIIAGGFLGWLAGWIAVHLWRRAQTASVPAVPATAKPAPGAD